MLNGREVVSACADSREKMIPNLLLLSASGVPVL